MIRHTAAMSSTRRRVQRRVLDTTVCHMAFFHDPDGNAVMLHNRYAPRVAE
jgi:hypothetical protein